jgi:BlaI family transcriptional regulator, penicillinase repressor
MKKNKVKPTDAELEILTVLWSRGPSTVKQVHESLISDPPRGYTTVLKLMQIMSEKGLVRRDENQKAHIYEATWTQEDTQQALVSNLMDKAFSGSAGRLVMQALSNNKTSKKELDEIRRLLKKMEEKQK